VREAKKRRPNKWGGKRRLNFVELEKSKILFYLEQEVTNFKNSRRSSSVKSFAKISHNYEKENVSEQKNVEELKMMLTQ
jgi:hypothetical protein